MTPRLKKSPALERAIKEIDSFLNKEFEFKEIPDETEENEQYEKFFEGDFDFNQPFLYDHTSLVEVITYYNNNYDETNEDFVSVDYPDSENEDYNEEDMAYIVTLSETMGEAFLDLNSMEESFIIHYLEDKNIDIMHDDGSPFFIFVIKMIDLATPKALSKTNKL